jgi:hypothetical protein
MSNINDSTLHGETLPAMVIHQYIAAPPAHWQISAITKNESTVYGGALIST